MLKIKNNYVRNDKNTVQTQGQTQNGALDGSKADFNILSPNAVCCRVRRQSTSYSARDRTFVDASNTTFSLCTQPLKFTGKKHLKRKTAEKYNH